MEIDLIFKIAGIGIIVSVLNLVLKRAEREEQAMMTTLAGLIVVLMLIVEQIGELIETADYNNAFMELGMGTADAIAVDYGVALYNLAAQEEGTYVILDEAVSSEQYAIGFLLGNTELAATVWEQVEAMAKHLIKKKIVTSDELDKFLAEQ